MVTTPKAGPNPTTPAVLKAARQAVASGADAQAADAVATLGLIQQARLSNQSRTVTLTVATYGKDSTQAVAATQAVTATTTARARLTALSQQLSTPAPPVAATGWALHGRIYSSDLAPQAGYVVFLVDAQKNYLSDVGFAYTDTTGYFLISNGGPATGQKATAAAAQSAAAPPQMFLQVADANANPVLLSATAFVPVTGKATYQAVSLPAGAPKLGDPPAALRSVALPPISAKTQTPTTPKATKQTSTKTPKS